MIPDERGSTSRKRKAPVPDSISAPKKPLRKKAKTSAATVDSPVTVSSPFPSSSISKSQRQRRPPQRNATPGPSNDTTPLKPQARPSTSVASNRKRLRTPDAIDSDWSPPPVSSLKSGRVPKPTAKSLASATPGIPTLPKKSQKLSSKRQKRISTVTEDVIEVLSTEDENERTPVPKRKRPQPTLRRKPLITASSDVIDLCSDDDDRCRAAKSSPVRTKLENDITVILSSEDESRLPSRSESKSGRPARLKKPTLKAQALLDRKGVKKASRDDMRSPEGTPVTLPPSSPGEESVRSIGTKSKRHRLSNAPSQSNVAPHHKSGPVSGIDNATVSISDPVPQSFADNEGAEGGKEAELQQAICDSLVQNNSEVNDVPLAELPSGNGDDADEEAGLAHGGDIRAAQEDSQSLPTQPSSDVISPEYPRTPALINAHVSTDSAAPQNAHAESSGPHVPINQSEPESHHSSDDIPDDAENVDHALQDTILLSLLWKEGGMDNVEDFSHPVEESPCVGANDPVTPSEESQGDPVNATIDNDYSYGLNADLPARPTTPSSPTNGETEDMGTPLAQDAGASELEPHDFGISLEIHTPSFLPNDVVSEDMNMQNTLLASVRQQEPVPEDNPPDTVISTATDSSSSGPGPVPSAPYSETIDNDTSPHLPSHLSHAPPPLPYIYGDNESGRSVSSTPIGDSIVGEERDARRDSAFAAGIAEKSLPVENYEFGSSESNTEIVLPLEESPVSVSAESPLAYQDESGEVQTQTPRALLQSLSSNEGDVEPTNENRGEHSSAERTGEELGMNSDPDPDTSHAEPLTMLLKYDCPVEEMIFGASAITASPLVPCDTSSYKPSHPFNGPLSSSNNYIAQSCTATKQNPSITYSSCPPTISPRLLTTSFFSQSFLQPNCVSEPQKALRGGSPAVVEDPPPPPQGGPQSFKLLRECSSTPPVSVSPQYDDEDDNPKTTDGLPASVVAQPSPAAHSESLCETAEEAEVDLQSTHVESDAENVPMLAAAVTEATLLADTFKDVQGGERHGPRAASSEHEHSDCQEQPKMENGSRQVSGSHSADAQQSSVESGKRDHNDTPERRYSSSEQSKLRVKSLSESSLDSLGTTEDSPAPTTPPVERFDCSSFFIRSSSPIDFGYDMLKDLIDLSASLPLDKDDEIDAYLLSHSFDYPDDVDVTG